MIGLVSGSIEFLDNLTRRNNKTHWVTHSKDHCNYSTYKFLSLFTSRCLVATFNGGRSPSSRFPNCPRPQLPNQSHSYVTTDGQSASLSWSKAHHLGFKVSSLILSDSCRLVDVGRSLWREDASVICQATNLILVIYLRHVPHRKHLVHYLLFSLYRVIEVSTELFPSDGSCTVACLHSCYLPMGLRATVLTVCVILLVVSN
jgi:hypothetical protein